MEPCHAIAASAVPAAKPRILPASLARSLVVGALLIGLMLRLIGLSYPPYDSHRFRQTQTLSTIEAFHADGIDLFHARAIYMGYPGIFVLELPLFQALVASLYGVFGAHLEIARVLNILFGAASTWLLYRIARFFLGRMTAILAALIYWLAPLNVLYQRSMLLDPMAVFCAMLSFYYLALLLKATERDSERGDQGRHPWRFAIFAMATWLTAMIKALYLWPTLVLLAFLFIARRFKFDSSVARIVAVFAASGVCFIAWNYYATQVNAESPITRGIKPTTCLGVSAVLTPGYYVDHLIRRPKWWLGVFGALLYPIGLLAGWTERRNKKSAALLWVAALAPPTYLLAFADINGHDYYQLPVTPFLAIVSGTGLCWLVLRFSFFRTFSVRVGRLMLVGAVAAGLISSVLTYCVWMRQPHVDEQVLKFRELCAGRFSPGSPAMVFVAWDSYGVPRNSYIPEFLYAARLWGYGRTVENAAAARNHFEQFRAGFQRLDYVLFYGTDKPDWLPKENFRLVTEDIAHRFYIFQRTPL